METNNQNVADDSSSSENKPDVKTYTEDEVVAKLRGKANLLSAEQEKTANLEAELAAYRQKEKEAEEAKLKEDGELKTLLERREAEIAARDEELSKLRERELTRMESLKKENERRIEALPKEYRDLVPKELNDQDAIRVQIKRIESLTATTTRQVNGGSGRVKDPKEQTIEESIQAGQTAMRNAILGIKEDGK